QRPAARSGIPLSPLNQTLAVLIFGLLTVQVWGPIAVAQVMLYTLVLMALQPWLMVTHIFRRGFIFTLPLLACLSTLWSLAPHVSLRYGLQILITALCGAALAIALAPRLFIRI